MKKQYFLWLLLGLVSQQAIAQFSAPSGLRINQTQPSALSLQWTPNEPSSIPYDVERSDNGQSNWNKVGTSDPVAAGTFAAGNYTDYNLNSSTTYYYRVRGNLGNNRYTAYSTVVNGKTDAAPAAPSAPTLSVLSAASIRVTWPTKTSLVYELEQRQGQTGNFSVINSQASGRNSSLTYDNTGLSSGTEYCYRVRIKDPSGGTSPYSTIVCTTTPSVPPVKPSQLTILSVSTSQLQLFWQDINVQAVTFEISRADSPGGTYKVISAEYGQKIYDDKNLPASTQYCYKVRAKNSAGLYSDYSNEACGTTKTPPATTPNAPARLTVSAVSSSQINLQWADLSDNETGFQVERATGGPTATFTKIADLDANATTYSDQSVQGSTQYCYRVRAVNAVGNSGYTDGQCATTPAPPAGVPQNLAASASSISQINLTWTGVAGASGYQLERSLTGNDSWQKIADPVASATSYADNGLTPNTTYYYRLRALNAGGAPGGYSNVASATTPDAPPAAPARLSITTVVFNQISLQWADLSTNESGFQIERSPDGNSWNKIADVGANSTTYNDQSVQAQTHYYYRVRAVNAAGPSDYTNTVDGTTPVGPPATAQNLVATAASTTQINLTWNAVANAASILIERSLNGTDNWNQIASVAGTATSYNDPNLIQNTHYYYRIRATNASGTSPYSDVADATTPDVPPVAPARLTATATSPNQVNLQWADLSTNESSFEIERGNSATGTFQKVADVPANATTYEDKNLTDNTQYCYRIRAKNAAGPSGFTDPACVTTPLAPPPVPTNLTAQVFDYDQIRLNWSPVGASAVTVYIERSTSPTSGFTEIKQQPVGSTTYVDIGLQAFTTYYYRIRVSNAAGYSGYSNVATARVEEVVIAVEDELETHTFLFVSQRTLHVITNWYSTIGTTVQLLTPTGQPVILDHRKVNPSDRWSYNLDTLPTGSYIISIVANGRKLAKRILLP